MSSPIFKITGIKIKTNNVEKRSPKTKVIAIGFNNWACTLPSNNNGVKPAIVVNDVNITALNLSWAPVIIALFMSIPVFIFS